MTSILRSLTAFTVLALAFAAQPALAAGSHKVAVHVDQNDKKVMNMALNNIVNLKAYYQARGEEVEIELVAYGPGLHMLREDSSPVKARIAKMDLEIEHLTFSACGNTQAKMSKKSGKPVKLISEARVTPSGVARLIDLQEQGYAYVRP
ncbi:MAG: hypothetical protein C0605_03895 [Hyphomicrobiales bacterium]|mgnify:CR=1 FL=1|nr:MAG: hypothetical protein C0605_03895 [Hyphomicrobiales bacterium]